MERSGACPHEWSCCRSHEQVGGQSQPTGCPFCHGSCRPIVRRNRGDEPCIEAGHHRGQPPISALQTGVPPFGTVPPRVRVPPVCERIASQQRERAPGVAAELMLGSGRWYGLSSALGDRQQISRDGRGNVTACSHDGLGRGAIPGRWRAPTAAGTPDPTDFSRNGVGVARNLRGVGTYAENPSDDGSQAAGTLDLAIDDQPMPKSTVFCIAGSRIIASRIPQTAWPWRCGPVSIR
jgi:hypothetical protein